MYFWIKEIDRLTNRVYENYKANIPREQLIQSILGLLLIHIFTISFKGSVIVCIFLDNNKE